MRRAHHRVQGMPALELIEQAVHLVRRNPGALAVYLLGTLPFALVFLFFCGEMSRSAYAREHLAPASLALAGAFLWMKGWQAVYTRWLRALICGHAPGGWTFRGLLRLFLAQAVVQPAGLFLLPVAALLTLPFGWGYAFFQNVTALGEAEDGRIGTLVRDAWRQATRWPAQNHLALLTAFCFSLFVFINWLTVGLALPYLGKTLFGVESVMTRAGIGAVLNTTFFAVIASLTALVADPVLKAVYALRCFHGQSLATGDDLLAGLASVENAEWRGGCGVRGGALALLLLLAAVVPAGAATEEGAVPLERPEALGHSRSPEVSVPPPALDRAIDEVLQQRKFTWRMPRDEDALDSGGNSFLTRFMEGVRDALKDLFMGFARFIENVLRRIFGNWRPGGGPGVPWYATLQAVTFVLLASIVAGLLFLLWRAFRGRNLALPIQAEVITSVPDLRDENLGAEQLPEDGWIRLGRELLARGEFRLALRAFYLASLAHLAERNLVQLARFKSNRDYETELRRRSHALPGMAEIFAENVSVFERVWYGRAEVDEGLVSWFSGNVQQLKGAAMAPPAPAGGGS